MGNLSSQASLHVVKVGVVVLTARAFHTPQESPPAVAVISLPLRSAFYMNHD